MQRPSILSKPYCEPNCVLKELVTVENQTVLEKVMTFAGLFSTRLLCSIKFEAFRREKAEPVDYLYNSAW